MGAKVSKACGALSGREGPSDDCGERRHSQPGTAALHHAATVPVAGAGRRQESLEWLNDLVATLWPKVDLAVQKIVQEQVTPQLQASMPGPLKGTHFKKFTLGTVTPRLGPIELVKREDGLKLVLGVDYQSDVDIEIAAVASIGIKSIALKGQLMIHLGPLIEESPVVGGMTAYFVDPPDLSLKFTGIGQVAQFPGIAGMIRGQISAAISNAVVLPNVVAVPLGTPEQGVDLARLKKPTPLAVLRATALRGKELAALDWNVMSKATSDPYVVISVANDKFQSSTIKANCNPEWTADNTHDFVVFDSDQHVWIEVFDEDKMSSSDFIGKAPKLKASSAKERQGLRSLQLSNPDKPEQNCGTLEMDFQWLSLLPFAPAEATGCVVSVEVRSLTLGPLGGKGNAGVESAAVKLTLCGQEKCTPVTAPPAPAPSSHSVAETLMEVAKRCKARGLDQDAIAEISGLPKEDLEKALEAGDASALASRELPIHTAFYFSVPRTELEAQELAISAADKEEKVFATATLKLAELVAGKAQHLDKLQLAGGGQLDTDIEISIFSLSPQK
mmetsp:Transcript_100272/g.239063  ORF Transcript_100272/g.239063 Transcript_100272/m.239063 type:complete len:559 (-) Transcript_100272:99-1775(-)